METHVGGDSGNCPDEACVTWFFLSSMACTMPWACCTDQPPCTTGFTGLIPSVCYEDYPSYGEAQAGIHADCFDDTGHTTPGARCTCAVGWDYQLDVDGHCDDDGLCDVEMPGDSPPVPGCK